MTPEEIIRKLTHTIDKVVQEAVAEERERCVARLKQMQDAAHQLGSYGDEMAFDRAIAAIRAEHQPKEAE